MSCLLPSQMGSLMVGRLSSSYHGTSPVNVYLAETVNSFNSYIVDELIAPLSDGITDGWEVVIQLSWNLNSQCVLGRDLIHT